MKYLVVLLLFCALAGSMVPAVAAPPRAPQAQASAAPPPDASDGEAADAVTQHTAVIGGQPVAYTARAGTITLRNDKEVPTARIFYTAYTIDGTDPGSRPVTFIYNGGPGSSTMWLRMGSLG